MKTGIITTDTYLDHDTGQGHPERADRVSAVIESLKKFKNKNLIWKKPSTFDRKLLEITHDNNYVNQVEKSFPEKGLIFLDGDTIVSPGSKQATLDAVGSIIAAIDGVQSKEFQNAFCAVRPPGHHAETERANGFCFINNVAVTARYLQSKYHIQKIAIIDFDVHHGNGTQEIFYQDKTVAYGSIHEHPLFPGTGSEQEIGIGNIFNAPIVAGTDGKDFIKILENRILDNIDKFKPEIILISAGFDAHKRDPLANINLESKDFFNLTQKIVEIANIHCQGRVISFLEGGYDLVALSESIKEHFLGLMEN